jgi:plasmid stabilization system protein ParE
MRYDLEIRPAARVDFDEASDYYLSKSSELRDGFVSIIGHSLDLITQRPHSFPIVFGSTVRKAVVTRFPYTIYFTAKDNLIVIHAIFHTSRNPIVWRGRVD